MISFNSQGFYSPIDFVAGDFSFIILVTFGFRQCYSSRLDLLPVIFEFRICRVALKSSRLHFQIVVLFRLSIVLCGWFQLNKHYEIPQIRMENKKIKYNNIE